MAGIEKQKDVIPEERAVRTFDLTRKQSEGVRGKDKKRRKAVRSV